MTALGAFLVDRVTKSMALALPAHRSVWIIGHVLALTRITNHGAAFGILQDDTWLFVTVALAVGAVLLTLPRQENGWLAVAYGLIVGGAAGNLWDRLLTGGVVDFINVSFWPGIFNAADSFVVVGVCLAAILLLRR